MPALEYHAFDEERFTVVRPSDRAYRGFVQHDVCLCSWYDIEPESSR